jgi:hypothetical protein
MGHFERGLGRYRTRCGSYGGRTARAIAGPLCGRDALDSDAGTQEGVGTAQGLDVVRRDGDGISHPPQGIFRVKYFLTPGKGCHHGTRRQPSRIDSRKDRPA